jgi:hypothetical protein
MATEGTCRAGKSPDRIPSGAFFVKGVFEVDLIRTIDQGG